MAFRISGFGAGAQEKKEMIPTYEADVRTIVPCKSLVQVRFPGKGIPHYLQKNAMIFVLSLSQDMLSLLQKVIRHSIYGTARSSPESRMWKVSLGTKMPHVLAIVPVNTASQIRSTMW